MTDTCPASRRVSLLAALAYAGTVLACVWLLKHPLADATVPVRAFVALLPIVPIVWLIRITVRSMLARDELQRRIDLEAIAIASLALGLGTLTLALLTVAELVAISGRTALTWVFPALWLGYGLARHWVARRYR